MTRSRPTGRMAAVACVLALSATSCAILEGSVPGAQWSTEQGTASASASASASATASPSAEPSPASPSPATGAPAPVPVPVAPAPALPPSTPTPAGGFSRAVPVTSVIDGDTIETTLGKVRFIGIDTPERGQCGYSEATNELARAIQLNGGVVVLSNGKGEDTDKYGRMLRYVDTVNGSDLHLHLLNLGLARARYDSRDGYGWHPREASYIAADAAGVSACGFEGGAVAPLPAVGAQPGAAATDPRFPSCKAAKAAGFGPYRAGRTEYGWYKDGDGDGIACE